MEDLPQLVDSGWRGGPEALLALVRPGGRIVMDDVTPDLENSLLVGTRR